MRELKSDLFMGLGFVLVLGVSTVCVQCSAPKPVHAQVAVIDPTNLGQNVVTAANSVLEVKNQVTQLQYQLNQISIMYKDLKTLSVADRAKLESSFYTIQSLSARSQMIAMQWDRTVQDFDRVYGKSAADKRRSEQTRQEQAIQTDRAYQDSMRSHAVIEKHSEREAQVQELVKSSYDAEGTVQAIQRAIQMLALLMHQLKEFEQVMLLDSRARGSDAMEQRRRSQEADQAASKRMDDWPADRPRRRTSGELPRLDKKGGR